MAAEFISKFLVSGCVVVFGQRFIASIRGEYPPLTAYKADGGGELESVTAQSIYDFARFVHDSLDDFCLGVLYAIDFGILNPIVEQGLIVYKLFAS